jgi:hypothetical protein
MISVLRSDRINLDHAMLTHPKLAPFFVPHCPNIGHTGARLVNDLCLNVASPLRVAFLLAESTTTITGSLG